MVFSREKASSIGRPLRGVTQEQGLGQRLIVVVFVQAHLVEHLALVIHCMENGGLMQGLREVHLANYIQQPQTLRTLPGRAVATGNARKLEQEHQWQLYPQWFKRPNRATLGQVTANLVVQRNIRTTTDAAWLHSATTCTATARHLTPTPLPPPTKHSCTGRTFIPHDVSRLPNALIIRGVHCPQGSHLINQHHHHQQQHSATWNRLGFPPGSEIAYRDTR